MPATVPAKLYEMAKSRDPKQAIINAVGDAIDKIHPRNNELLVGTYISSDVISTIKGVDGKVIELIKADMNKAEDVWQGNLGLVLKKGPMAFKDDERLDIYWDGQDVEQYQWVLFRYSASWETHLNGASVRFVQDRDIKAVIDDPNIIVSKRNVAVE